MRRYSEMPNTPTPFGKTTANTDIRIGSLITLPRMGKAVLRFVGSIEGKPGVFAGIELLGESASLGKNSGDVNGVQYFFTKKKGSGLFMAYDKLVSSAESVEPSKDKRTSLISPPGVKFNQTPSRSATVKYVSSPAISTIKRGKATNSTTADVKIFGSLEHEVQKLKSTKAVIEAERNQLLTQTQNLKEEIKVLTAKNSENKELIHHLELKYEECKFNYNRANDRAEATEAKLSKQKKLYEEQREELLDVIDQVETRVNENERTYVTELKSLQNQLSDRQDEIDALLRAQIINNEGDPLARAISRDEIANLKDEIKNLRLTNETQSKAIIQLQTELEEKEERMIQIHKDNLELKQAYASDIGKTNEEFQAKFTETVELLKEKENEVEELKKSGTSIAVNTGEIDELKLKIEILEDRASKALEYESEISRLNKEIAVLEKKLDTIKPEDAVFELEYKLEGKEKIIEDLKKELLEKENEVDEKVSFEEVEALKKDLDNKQKEVLDLTQKIIETDKLKEELLDKDSLLETLSNELETIKQEKENKTKDFDSFKQSWKSQEEVDSLALKESLMQKESELSILSKEIKTIKEKDCDFTRQIAAKDEEINKLIASLEELKVSKTSLSDLETRLQEREALIEKQTNEITKLTEKNLSIEDFKAKLTQKERELSMAQTKIESLQAEDSNGLDEIVESLRTENSRLQDDLALAKIQLETLNIETSSDKSLELATLIEEKNLEIDLLKEELSQIKSGDTFKEIESLKKDLKNEKHLTHSTANKELRRQIELLQDELETRPSSGEMQELRAEMELIDELRKVESKTKDREIYLLQEKLRAFTQSSSPGSTTSSRRKDYTPLRNSVMANCGSTPTNMARPPVISQVIDGELLVYVPDKKDPSSGRELWCGLCERDGHDSIDCPYENDVF